MELEKCKKTRNSFEEGWPLLQTAVDKLINQTEGASNSSLTVQDYISCYTTVYDMCNDHQLGHDNCKLLYAQYKKLLEEHIDSRVIPSLGGKKDELLLRELLRKWSNYKVMTKWLLKLFRYLSRYYIPRRKLPSLEDSSFFLFYDLLHDKINEQVADAVSAMIVQERAGEQIDRTLVINTLAMYSEIGDILLINNAIFESLFKKHAIGPRVQCVCHEKLPSGQIPCKEEKLHDIPTPSSKKIRLVSSDGDLFEVDYGVALMSKTIEDAIKANPAGDTDHSILVYSASSKILTKVIEYCKKHSTIGDMSGVDIKGWDAEFVQVDHGTLFGLYLCANFLNIKSLLDLTDTTMAVMIHGKAREVIRQMFNVKDN